MNLIEVNKLIYKFEHLGKEQSIEGAILIGRAIFKGPKAWINIMYPKLNTEELASLERDLNIIIPREYKDFLRNYSNGSNVLSSTFSLYGLRRQLNRDPEASIRQPYSIITPNIYERPDNAKSNHFFIGGYNWDGSHLYIDTETNIVHCCERWNSQSKIQWTSFEDMIISEITRLYKLFDDEGKEIDEEIETIPY